jgi:hypothetical protein
MLFDLGAPGAPPLTRRALRQQVIDRQQGRCANEKCAASPKSLDVVRLGDGTLVAFCRPCRLRWDAAARAEKARATRGRGVQLRLPGTRQRIGAPMLRLPSARTLVEEAMSELRARDSAPSSSRRPLHLAEDGARALIEVLRRRGLVFEEEGEQGT